MQIKNSIATLSVAGAAIAAYVPSEPWSTLTPSATYKNGITDYVSTFGVAVKPLASSASASKAKRDVISQINDGQIQATTKTKNAVSKKSEKPKKTNAPAVVSQITDGQIQATTKTTKKTAAKKTTAPAVVSQITDGQIQATTKTTKKTAAKKTTAPAVVSQITDGQIQATTKTQKPKKTTAQAVVSEITDGQIQATTKTEKPKKTTAPAVISQITDGQVQATTKTKSTKAAVSQITDGQAQAKATSGAAAATATASASASSDEKDTDASTTTDPNDPVDAVSCKSDGTLQLTLKEGVVTDEKGRIGSIVSNRQFQFDGPPPQAGAIYAAGWSITPEGNLALGDQDVFFQCLSGNFYNLYDKHIGSDCSKIHLEVVDLVAC